MAGTGAVGIFCTTNRSRCREHVSNVNVYYGMLIRGNNDTLYQDYHRNMNLHAKERSLRKFRFVPAACAACLFFECATSPTGPQNTQSANVTLTAPGSSSIAVIVRTPDKTSYAQGDTVTLVAVPRSGYTFTGWSGDIAASGDTLKIVMKKNITVYADFLNTVTGKKVYTVNTIATNGSVRLTPAGGVYDSGTSVTAIAIPDYGFAFSGWEGAAPANQAEVVVSAQRNVTLTANFGMDPGAVFAIMHISPAPANGKIVTLPAGVQSGDGLKFKPGTDVAVTAVPDDGCELIAWGGDFAQNSAQTNPITVTMNRDRTISATFSKAAPGGKWTMRTSDIGYGLISAIWDGRQVVVSGNGGAILTSPDGVAWKSMVIDSEACLNCVIYNGSQYVCVGDVGVIYTSTDAKTWVKRNSNTTYSLQSVAWNGSKFVAVGGYFQNSGSTYDCTVTSPDGATWTDHSGGSGISYGIVWTGSKFVSVAFIYNFTTVSDNSRSFAGTSSDGQSWTASSTYIPQTASLVSIIWTGSQLVAVGGCRNKTEGALSSIYTSTDGDVWERQSVTTRAFLNCVASTGGGYVAVGDSGTVFTSIDSKTWKKQPSGTTRDIYGVAWTGSKIVAVGNAGLILTSP
jgi:uncharacterized repeat protein (TIGR02543 family)